MSTNLKDMCFPRNERKANHYFHPYAEHDFNQAIEKNNISQNKFGEF